MLALAEMIRAESGNSSAIHFMLEALAKRPTVRGFDRLLDFASDSSSADVPDHLDVMKGLLGQLLNDRPVYQCRHCGFAARSPALAMSRMQALEHRPPRPRGGRRVGESRWE